MLYLNLWKGRIVELRISQCSPVEHLLSMLEALVLIFSTEKNQEINKQTPVGDAQHFQISCCSLFFFLLYLLLLFRATLYSRKTM